MDEGWYLPANAELQAIYFLRKELSEAAVRHGGRGFKRARYWSSSEIDAETAWSIDFAGESDLSLKAVRKSKKLTGLVRPVAEF